MVDYYIEVNRPDVDIHVKRGRRLASRPSDSTRTTMVRLAHWPSELMGR